MTIQQQIYILSRKILLMLLLVFLYILITTNSLSQNIHIKQQKINKQYFHNTTFKHKAINSNHTKRLKKNIQSITSKNHKFNLISSCKIYSIIKKNVKKSIDYTLEIIKSSKKIKYLESILKQEAPLIDLTIKPIYKYKDKHIFSTKYQFQQLYIPLKQIKKQSHSLYFQYQYQMNHKIRFNVFSYKQLINKKQYYTTKLKKQNLKSIQNTIHHHQNNDKSNNNLKTNQINDFKSISKKQKYISIPIDEEYDKHFVISTGIHIFQPINYRCHIKLPIISYHKGKINYYSQHKSFGYSTSHIFQYNIHKHIQIGIKYKAIGTYQNKLSHDKKFKSYQNIKLILKTYYKFIHFNLSYGVTKNKHITSLFAHEISIKISLKNY